MENDEPVSVRREDTWEASYGAHFIVLGSDIPMSVTCIYTDDEAERSDVKAGRMRIQIGDQEPIRLVLGESGKYDAAERGSAG